MHYFSRFLVILLLLSFTLSNCRAEKQKILFDFESDRELDLIHWQCHVLFSLSGRYATRGNRSLKMELFPSNYPGFSPARMDGHKWSPYTYFSCDIFNPERHGIRITLRIDDKKDAFEYADRYNHSFNLHPGPNPIKIPLQSLITSGTGRTLNLKNIRRFMLFVVDPPEKISLYIDNIRLES